MTVMIAITLAKIGRSMKKRDIVVPSAQLSRDVRRGSPRWHAAKLGCSTGHRSSRLAGGLIVCSCSGETLPPGAGFLRAVDNDPIRIRSSLGDDDHSALRHARSSRAGIRPCYRSLPSAHSRRADRRRPQLAGPAARRSASRWARECGQTCRERSMRSALGRTPRIVTVPVVRIDAALAKIDDSVVRKVLLRLQRDEGRHFPLLGTSPLLACGLALDIPEIAARAHRNRHKSGRAERRWSATSARLRRPDCPR